MPASLQGDDYDPGTRSPSIREGGLDGENSVTPRAKDSSKRRHPSQSDESDFDIPIRHHPLKRRKNDEIDDITDELERSVADDNSRAATPAGKWSKKGKSKLVDDMMKDGHRKGKRKRNVNDPPESFTPSKYLAPSEDGTPLPSAPNSPTLKNVYELSEPIPALRKPAKKLEGAQAARRVKAVEDAQLKVWTTIARKDVQKVKIACVLSYIAYTFSQAYKMHVAALNAKTIHCKRIAHMCLNPAKKPLVKTTKSNKETLVRSKRLMRDMLVFWRKNEKEERDVRKRAEKEAVDRAKEEEERREAARQARKLEFLISQTELYSHFVGNKLKSKSQFNSIPLTQSIF
jgi:DNA helicase INO80